MTCYHLHKPDTPLKFQWTVHGNKYGFYTARQRNTNALRCENINFAGRSFNVIMKAHPIRKIMGMVLAILVISTLLPTAASAGASPNVSPQKVENSDVGAYASLVSATPYGLATYIRYR